MSEGMPDKVPECLPDRMPEDLPDNMPEDMPEDMPDRMPEDMPEHMPGRMPEDMPDRMPEDMPDRMPEGMPDRMQDKMSDRMPEDLPVTKCINVMVGITRSKVIVTIFYRPTLGRARPLATSIAPQGPDGPRGTQKVAGHCPGESDVGMGQC